MGGKQITKNENQKREKPNIFVDKYKIVHVKVLGGLDIEGILKLIDEIVETINKLAGKTKVLINVTEAGIFTSSQARKKLAARIKERFKYPRLEKVAVFGGNIVQRTVGLFVVSAAGIKNMKFFKAKTEALKWLKR